MLFYQGLNGIHGKIIITKTYLGKQFNLEVNKTVKEIINRTVIK